MLEKQCSAEYRVSGSVKPLLLLAESGWFADQDLAASLLLSSSSSSLFAAAQKFSSQIDGSS